jgi:hypothetical protein
MKTQKEPFFNCRHPVIFRLGLVLVMNVFFPLACGMPPRSAYLTDQRFPPKPPSAPIEIFSGLPDKPYILIGEISAGQYLFGNAIEKSKEIARDMGGDAIINYRGYAAPAGTVAAGAFTAQGMVVRWKGEDQTGRAASAGMNEYLMKVAFRGDLPEVKLLLAAGAAVNAKDEKGRTALILASMQGHREVVQALLAAGAEVNAKSTNGKTALMLATEKGHREVIELLLKAGAK